MSMLWMLTMACGPKEPVQEAPKLGWYQAEVWSVACYHPPAYESMTEMERRDSWQNVYEAMFAQWRGDRGDGMNISQDTIDKVDYIFSAYPDKVETVSQQNLEQCRQVATGQKPMGEWLSWISALPTDLMAGECNTHFLDTVMDNLQIDMDFANGFPVCKGDQVKIAGSINDQYRISDSGEWINIQGDLNSPSLGKEDLPCNIEGCFDGMLILKFTDRDGRETVYPVGQELIFKAPQDGQITYGINDDTFYDNQWYQSGGLIDHTSITMSPVD